MSQKNGTNGRASMPEATAKEEPKPEASVVSVNEQGQLNGNEPAPAPQPLSVEEKINKINSLNELIDMRSTIKSHLSRVEAMKFDDFSERNIITISSQNGQSYAIKSGYLTEKIASMLKEEFQCKIKEVEAQIAF
jgi:hypothetical protein